VWRDESDEINLCVLIFFFALLVGFCPAAQGQAITATLSGRVADTSGGSVSKSQDNRG